jgi:glycosyltransferase involved in cell wall biosynthesis
MLLDRFQQFFLVGAKAKVLPRLMLFDLDIRGHHPGYIQHLVKYWCEENLAIHLDVLVSRQFLQQHSNIVDLVAAYDRSNIQFVAISHQEQKCLVDSAQLEHSFKGRIIRAFQELRILKKYTKALKTSHCFLMYLDTILLRLALPSRLPCSLSAIYFRPILHYGSFPNYLPEGKENVWAWRDRVCLARLLKHPNLATLFCLDPFAVDHINQVYSTTKAVELPDPVQIYPPQRSQLEQLEQQLGIQANRTVFLLFGALSARKGLCQVLEAMSLLSAPLAERVTLLFVGPIAAEDQAELDHRVSVLRHTSCVQIICHHDFIPDEAIQAYFAVSDVILAPYQRHIGMSAILVRAAAAQKPVLASDFGLMGEVTHQHELGLAINARDPQDIANGMIDFLLQPPEKLCDPVKMRQFAHQNSAREFSIRVFQELIPTFTAQTDRSLIPNRSENDTNGEKLRA